MARPAVPPAGAQQQAPQVVQRPAPAPARTSPARGNVSLNFDDADVYSVIQTVFGDILKVNYIVDQRVKGRVTFRSVTPVQNEQVLPIMEVILRLNGIGVVEDAGLYRIIPISEIAREPAPVGIGRDPEKVIVQGRSLIQVVPIIYVHSTEIIKLITPFLSTSAVAIDVPNVNQLVFVDTDANVKRLLQLVELFDSETAKRKKPQVYVYHVQNGKAKEIANTLQQIFLTGRGGMSSGPVAAPASSPQLQQPRPQTPGAPTQPPASSPSQAQAQAMAAGGAAGDMLLSPLTRILPDEILNSIIVLATPEDYELIRETIEKVDIVPRQVVLEGVVAGITLKDEFKLGISWALQLSEGGMGGLLGKMSGQVGFNMPGATPGTATGAGTFTFAGSVGQDFKTIINMLASQGKGKLLAAPYILVSDNREARIQVGQQVPIVTSETFGSTTVAPQRTIQYKDIGIILKVKPRINEGGLVSLDLAQEVSTYTTIKLFADETNIIVEKTEATTNLVVQDGQTIIIGGLIREDNKRSRSGIPVFSRLPIIGYLFGSTEDSDERIEIIILLTPKVIKNQREAQGITTDYIRNTTDMGKTGLRRDEIVKQPKPVQAQGQGVDVFIPLDKPIDPGNIPVESPLQE
jgi:type II secretory pathway component GspD/PulD (secretin)